MAYAKPSSVTRTSNHGRYSGAVSYTVKGTTGYYVYAMDPSTYKYWRKGQISSSSGLSISLGGDDSSSDSWTTCIVLSSEDLGSSCTVGNSYSSSLYYVTVPLYVCRIYKGSSTLYKYDNCSQPDLWSTIKRSDYDEVYGLTTSKTSISPSTYPDWDGYGDELDGGTFYTIYYSLSSDSTSTCYYYRGSSTRKSVTKTTTTTNKYLYGTGTTSGGSETTSYGSMTTSCLSNSSYKLLGWTSSSSSMDVEYSSAIEAFDAGNTTIYGIYYREESITEGTVYYYRGSAEKQSVEETATRFEGYYYGKGSKQGGEVEYSHGLILTSCLSDSDYSLIGWTGNQTSTTVEYEDAEEAFNTYDTIYGIYKKDTSSSRETCYYYRGNSTKRSVIKTITSADAYYYGTGQQTGGELSNSYGEITTDCAISGWTFIGFATDENTQSSTSSAVDLFEAGSTTIYGTYNKDETMTYYPENGGESGTSSVTNYRYGTGSVTANYPVEPTLVQEDYTHVGWGTTSGATTYSTWNALWDKGTRTVYAIWVQNGNVYYGINDRWILCDTYYGANDVWVPMTTKYGTNNIWK